MHPETSLDPIFVIGAHKSGTSLLRSLLDGHPELRVLPREPHFFERSGLRVRYPLRRTPGRLSDHEEFGRAVAAALSAELQDENPYSDSPGWSGYRVETFTGFWAAHPTTDVRSRYGTYLEALWAAADMTAPRGRFVDKSTEYIEFAPTLRAWYPGSQFIHVVRNPYANVVGIRRYHARTGGPPQLSAAVRSVAMSLHAAEHYEQSIPRYFIVRFEDLLDNPAATMQGLAAKIGLPFVEELLTPTLAGQPWGGNSVDDVRRAEVRREPLTGWQGELHTIDIGLVNAAIPNLANFGYDRLGRSAAHSPWVARLPGEDPLEWVRNRVLYACRRASTRTPGISDVAIDPARPDRP